MSNNNINIIKMVELMNNMKQNQKSDLTDLLQNPQIEAVNITLLLKSLGFQLIHFDFDDSPNSSSASNASSSANANPKANEDDLVVNIKCKKSGITSVLSYNILSCTCPPKLNLKDTTFWEVQGIASKVNVRNASSNLLPELSENCSLASKAILTNILSYYQQNINNEVPAFDASSMYAASPKYRSIRSTPPAEGKSFLWNVEKNEYTKSDIDITPKKSVESNVKKSVSPPKNNEGTPKAIVIKEVFPAATENQESSFTASEINNDLPVIPEAPKAPEIQVTETVLNKTITKTENAANAKSENADDLEAQDEVQLDMINASPIDPPYVNDRDISVIQSLEDARKLIETALLYMKLNEIVSSNSLIPTTPQQPQRNAKELTVPVKLIRSSTMTTFKTSSLRKIHPTSPQKTSPRATKASKCKSIDNRLAAQHIMDVRRSLCSYPSKMIRSPSDMTHVTKKASPPPAKKPTTRTGISTPTPFSKILKPFSPMSTEKKMLTPSYKKVVESKVGSFRDKTATPKGGSVGKSSTSALYIQTIGK